VVSLLTVIVTLQVRPEKVNEFLDAIPVFPGDLPEARRA
jgi:hypothetical protein